MKKNSIKVLNQDAVKHCFSNGIKIYPIHRNYKMYIAIERGLEYVEYKEPYSDKTIHNGIIDMYERIYKKSKK